MPKKQTKSSFKSNKFLIWIGSAIIVALVIGGVYAFRPQKASIFEVNTIKLVYGPASLTGTVQKDAPLGATGNYLLVLSDGQTIKLDVKSIDMLVGQKVTIKGDLYPAIPINDLPRMVVSEIMQ